MTSNRIGTGSAHSNLQDARTQSRGIGGTRGRVPASSELPSSDSFIASQLARLRNLIATDQIDHNARRGTYLNILL